MSPTRPLRVAIVGSGPSGIYAADLLTKGVPPATVDVFERLPAPFGLVRYGVAPDHPNIKQIITTLAEVLGRDGIRLLANVDIGTDIGLDELRGLYDAVIVATGSPNDAPLDLPGVDLEGSFGSAEFVSWYDGHPDSPRAWPLTAREVAIVGVGNVALDIARILSKRPEDLAWTDMPDDVMRGLESSPVKDIHIFGRRGAAQVRFSPLELREIGSVEGVDVVVNPEDLVLDEASRVAIEGSRQTRQVVDTLTEWAHRKPTGAQRCIHLHLLQRPVAILADGTGVVAGIRMERMRLMDAGSVEGTGEFQEYPVQAVYRAVGYRGAPIEGLPFDASRGVVRNVAGRVVDEGGSPIPGVYATGWIKRGPSGLIGHSKKDAQETVERIAEDAEALVAGGQARDAAGPEVILRMLGGRGIAVIQWKDWEVLDAHERALGAARGRERVKVASREEMTDIALRRA